MPTVLQICVEGNTGSTGRIAENIGLAAMANGWKSIIAHGRFPRPSRSEIIRIGKQWDVWAHGLQTRLFDRHGLASKSATRKLVREMAALKPDIIHLHHLHGYYLNLEILFDFLRGAGIPVIWTFHDCWSVTGHCAYFDLAGCERWRSGCHDCPQKRVYPASWLLDRSRRNYREKRELFRSVERMTIVPVSRWLSGIVGDSFLAGHPRRVIANGIDLRAFNPGSRRGDIPAAAEIGKRFMILGVANIWGIRKGLQDFIRLGEQVDDGTVIVLVGLSRSERRLLPKRILGLGRTENQAQLAALYATAGVYLNPTWEDSFPTTNLEALACGTPVVTYRTGGSPESVTNETGFVVERGDIDGLRRAVEAVRTTGKDGFSSACRERAVALYDRDERCADYVGLYEDLIRPGSKRSGVQAM